MFESWPFTNFHDLNLDWLIGKWKKLEDNLDDIHDSMDAAAESATEAAGSANEAADSATEAAGSATDAADSAEEAATTANQLANLTNQVTVNTGRIDALIANAGDTDNNAELLGIRIGENGNTYTTAGNGVRSIAQEFNAFTK